MLSRLLCGVLFLVGFLFSPAAAAQNIIITGLEDYNFGTHTVGSGNKILTHAVCVGKDAGSTQWTLTATGSGVGGIFTLDDGGGNTVSYTVEYQPATNITAILPQTLSNADNAPPLDCDGIDNQQFEITLPGALLDSLPAGTYTGTLQLLASP